MQNNENLIIISFFVGFIGDMLTQFLFSNDPALSNYFKQHGSSESLFIAGGMMTLFMILYLYLGLNTSLLNKHEIIKTLLCASIYGIILDIIFRKFKIFPSLNDYYNNLNYFYSGFFAVLPMCLPFIILLFI